MKITNEIAICDILSLHNNNVDEAINYYCERKDKTTIKYLLKHDVEVTITLKNYFFLKKCFEEIANENN